MRESSDWGEISRNITELLDSPTSDGLELLYQGFLNDPSERGRPPEIQTIRGRRNNVEFILLHRITEQRAVVQQFLPVDDPARPRSFVDVGMQYRPEQGLLITVSVARDGNSGGDEIALNCMMVLEKAPKEDEGDDSTISKDSSGGFKTLTDSGPDWTSVEA